MFALAVTGIVVTSSFLPETSNKVKRFPGNQVNYFSTGEEESLIYNDFKYEHALVPSLTSGVQANE